MLTPDEIMIAVFESIPEAIIALDTFPKPPEARSAISKPCVPETNISTIPTKTWSWTRDTTFSF